MIVVEPSQIAGSGPHGIRLLFVALTRAVQHLAIAHTGDLPPELREAESREAESREAELRDADALDSSM